jgi:hypothetical protein
MTEREEGKGEKERKGESKYATDSHQKHLFKV